MKIKKITLFNVGPYSGVNEFDIDCADKSKNIVLIGGKNGAGKTTFFTSLRTCLYGHKAYGYENTNQHYFDEIYKLVNDNEKEKDEGLARVELNLLFDDGMDNNEYQIVREWKINNRKMTEEYHIYLNNNELFGDELVDFENYLLHIIPPNLFKFYFFDGEKIGEFFLKSNQDNSFKNAFLTMTGYDNIELLIKNFKRNISNKTKNNSKSYKYFSLQSEIEKIEQELNDQKTKLKELNDQKIEVEDNIAKLEKDYSKNGGLSIEQWQAINKELVVEEGKREESHRMRKDFANTEIPYVILYDKMLALKEQIDVEEKLTKKYAILEYINKETLTELLSKDLEQSDRDKVIKTITKYIDKKISVEDDEKIVLGLSNQEKNEVLSQIERHLGFDKNIILELSNRIKKSLNTSQKLRKQLEKSNIDKYEEFMEMKQDFLNLKASVESNAKALEIEIFKTQSMFETKQSEFKKVKKEYEEELKALSVNDISSRSLLALSDVSEKLLRTQIDKVENNFKKIFSKIINKEDFIDGIYIDEKLNIYPYKNHRVKKSQIIEAMKKTKSLEEYVGKIGMEIINEKMNDENDYIDIPNEITSPFSQGEKQVYIMSIYFALMQISRVDVPFVIDTPFARIDTEHRSKIVKNFFTKLKGQVFILSTDEEINNDYMKNIKPNVSNQYLLEYVSRGKTKVLKDQYFGGNS
ncbi:MAG: AAA family ATPase [Clostridia bacterium]|nr:AAA family ATPase [Clostridia bacterium]